MLPTLQLLDLTAYGRQETWEEIARRLAAGQGWLVVAAWRAADCAMDAYGGGGQIEANYCVA